MENKCFKCGGDLVNGILAGMNGLYFYAAGEIKKFRPKKMSKIVCDCCKDCGAIQNLRATEVEKIK